MFYDGDGRIRVEQWKMSDRDGVNLWKRIGETLAEEIGKGGFAVGERLPASADLAGRFGVNKHTVLRAISHLQDEGLVRIERGRGAFVTETIPYRMGLRTRFEENLRELNRSPSRSLISVAKIPASAAIAAALDLCIGESVTLVTLLAVADGVPISLNRNYFPTNRLCGIGKAFQQRAEEPGADLATKTVLASLGVSDFKRKTIRIRGRRATQEEARHLRMPPQNDVFEVDVQNVDADGRLIVFGQTSFCLTRVEFVWDLTDGD